MTEIFDRTGIASLRKQRPVKAYETPQHYYEGPAGANIGERLLSLQREGLSIPMHTFLGQNVSGQWGEYTPDKEYKAPIRKTHRDRNIGFQVGRPVSHINVLNAPLLVQEKSYVDRMLPEQAEELQKFTEGQDKKHGTRAWLQRRYRNVPKHTRPPLEAPLALLLSTQSHPDEAYAELSPERNIEIQRTRNIDLKNVARHEAGHHGLELSGEQGEEFNRPMDYLTITDEDPYYRKAALKHLGITEPEMIRMLESETAFRKKLNKMLKESNARLIAQGRPPIDNQAVIKKALAERRQALSRPVYPDIPERGLYTGYDTASRGKENNTGGIIERNPYPYESRAI